MPGFLGQQACDPGWLGGCRHAIWREPCNLLCCKCTKHREPWHGARAKVPALCPWTRRAARARPQQRRASSVWRVVLCQKATPHPKPCWQVPLAHCAWTRLPKVQQADPNHCCPGVISGPPPRRPRPAPYQAALQEYWRLECRRLLTKTCEHKTADYHENVSKIREKCAWLGGACGVGSSASGGVPRPCWRGRWGARLPPHLAFRCREKSSERKTLREATLYVP